MCHHIAFLGQQQNENEEGITSSQTVIQSSQVSRVSEPPLNQISVFAPLIPEHDRRQGHLANIFANATFQNCVININGST